MLRGKELNKTTTFFENKLYNYKRANKLIIKFVNGNSILPWLTYHFNFEYKPLYLIRHPYAVVASQIKHKGWENNKIEFVIPEMKFNDNYILHKEFLKTLCTLEEKLLATWCLTNLSTLRSKKNNVDWITIYYEHLVINPEYELNRIFTEWDIPLPDQISTSITKPSKTTIKGSPIEGQAQLQQWTQNISPDKLERMNRIMKYFSVEFYDPTDIMPIKIIN